VKNSRAVTVGSQESLVNFHLACMNGAENIPQVSLTCIYFWMLMPKLFASAIPYVVKNPL